MTGLLDLTVGALLSEGQRQGLQDIAVIAIASTAVMAGLRLAYQWIALPTLRRDLRNIEGRTRELERNGGQSIKDAVHRTDSKVDVPTSALAGQLEELRDEVKGLRGVVNDQIVNRKETP